jgi:MFS family permease
VHWRRNLWVALFGSFTTIVAMTLMLPFLPLYVEQLGVHEPSAIVEWSGICYGATFFSAALMAPVWGRLADRYGRKLMMIRASLGMAVAMSLMGLAGTIWQLAGLRLLAGVVGGYASGSMVLVATQTPKRHSGWALGVLSSGIMAGTLAGPLIGGILPPLIGIRRSFFSVGGLIFLAFLASVFLLREAPRPARQTTATRDEAPNAWSLPVVVLLATGTLLLVATMSIEPIITLYVAELGVDPARVTLVSGVVLAASPLGSICSASMLGRLADRIGHWPVIASCLVVASLLLVPQALVGTAWQLIGLRFLMGLSLGGLMPCITSTIRHSVPDRVAGRMLGYATSFQYAGQVAGPLLGGFLGGRIGMRAVFLGTAALMAAGSAIVWAARPAEVRRSGRL